MRTSNDKTLKEIIMDLLKAYRIENKVLGVRLINSWEKVTGKLISNHTTNLYIKKKPCLFTLIRQHYEMNFLIQKRKLLKH